MGGGADSMIKNRKIRVFSVLVKISYFSKKLSLMRIIGFNKFQNICLTNLKTYIYFWFEIEKTYKISYQVLSGTKLL